MPGIDLLFNQYNYNRPHAQGRQFGNVMMVKEVSSVVIRIQRTGKDVTGAGSGPAAGRQRSGPTGSSSRGDVPRSTS